MRHGDALGPFQLTSERSGRYELNRSRWKWRGKARRGTPLSRGKLLWGYFGTTRARPTGRIPPFACLSYFSSWGCGARDLFFPRFEGGIAYDAFNERYVRLVSNVYCGLYANDMRLSRRELCPNKRTCFCVICFCSSSLSFLWCPYLCVWVRLPVGQFSPSAAVRKNCTLGSTAVNGTLQVPVVVVFLF